MTEQREFFRKSGGFPAHFTIAGGQKREATLINFSAGGFCFCAQQDLPSGAVVQLHVSLEPNVAVSLNVRTAWSKKIGDTGEYMLGVKIADAEGTDLVRFLEYYSHELSQFLNDLKDINKD